MVFEEIINYFKSVVVRVRAQLSKGVSLATRPGLCCFNVDSRYIHLAYVVVEDGKRQLLVCESERYDAEIGWISVLRALVQRHHLENVRCSWVLSPQNFHMILTEELPVTAAEFQSAIRWKIKASLSFPVEEAVIDSFLIPPKKSITTNDNLMVIAAQKSFLQPTSEKIIAAGLRLNIIDISILALKNISSLYETDEKSTALVFLQAQSCRLIITCQKQLYFVRAFDCNAEELAGGNVLDDNNKKFILDKLALDIQRSFDYYQSAWRQPQPARLLFGAIDHVAPDVIDYLSQHLPTPLTRLNTESYLQANKEITQERQNKCLLAIGGALRVEALDHVAAN